MFNLQGSEIIFILLIALVVLGPEKLPGAIRRVTSLYAELRKLSSGFQDEFKSALDEPLREMKSTADLMKNAADPKRILDEAEREAEIEAVAEKKARQARDTTWAMKAAGAAHLAEVADQPTDETGADIDAFADPVDPVDPVEDAPGSDTGSDTESVDDMPVIEDTPAVEGVETVEEIHAVDDDSAEGDGPDARRTSAGLEFKPEEKSA